MAFSVVFSHPLVDVPAEVCTRVRRDLEEIGRTIESLPVGGELLKSVSQSPMQLDVNDWRFFFKLEPESRRLVVTSAVPAPPGPVVRDDARRK